MFCVSPKQTTSTGHAFLLPESYQFPMQLQIVPEEEHTPVVATTDTLTRLSTVDTQVFIEPSNPDSMQTIV